MHMEDDYVYYILYNVLRNLYNNDFTHIALKLRTMCSLIVTTADTIQMGVRCLCWSDVHVLTYSKIRRGRFLLLTVFLMCVTS